MVNTLVFKTNHWEFESLRAGKIKIMNELETKIIELRKEGLTYRAIQLKLGNPSKKFIRETLLKYEPDLVGDVVTNYGRLK